MDGVKMILNIFKDGALLPLKTYQKVGGAFKNENDLDFYIKHNNEFVKFPKKDNCLINLDYTSFSGYKQFGLRSHCIEPNFIIRKSPSGTLIDNLEGYIDDPGRNANYGVNREKCVWYIGRSQSDYIYRPERTFRSFTIQMRFKCYLPAQPWAPIIWLDGNDQQKLRIETTDNNSRCGVFVEDRTAVESVIQLPFNPYVNETDLIMMYDQNNLLLTIYIKQNGEADYNKYEMRFVRDFNNPFTGVGINSHKRLARTTNNQMTIKSFRLWDNLLTEQELKSLEHFDVNKWQQ